MQNRKLHSIFFGGGTPSLFSANAIETIVNEAQRCIGFKDNIEITLEANPGTSEQQKFADFRAAGINRLSIGVQSFDNRQLQALGRIHDGQQAYRALEMAQSAGFERLNIDLMHGLPNQNAGSALSDIEAAINSGVTHISWYQLTIEPNTEFFSSPPILPVEDQLADIQQAGQIRLQEAGFDQYEVSAFAMQGAVCEHNINYWQFGDYLGIGAGAHGKITLANKNRVIRTSKTRQPKHFLAKPESPAANHKSIDKSQLPLEFMMNGLRLKSGVSADLFPVRTGLSAQTISQQIKKLQSQGLLKNEDPIYCTSDLGYRFLNTVLQGFS